MDNHGHDHGHFPKVPRVVWVLDPDQTVMIVDDGSNHHRLKARLNANRR